MEFRRLLILITVFFSSLLLFSFCFAVVAVSFDRSSSLETVHSFTSL